MQTKLNRIRQHKPFAEDWKRLLRSLGKHKADDEPLSILTILDRADFDIALWCLRTVEGYEREIQLYAVWCTRQVEHLMTDPRSIAVINVAERFANRMATQEELTLAGVAAKAAVSEVARAEGIASGGLVVAPWLVRDDVWELSGVAAAAAANAARLTEFPCAAASSAYAAAIAAQEKRLREVCAECQKSRISANKPKPA
jgi:hypothetical protein